MKKIQMVDLATQYERLKPEIDEAVLDCLASTAFINGPPVKGFEDALAECLDVKHVIACANGTDALQIALMAIGLKPGDEVIVPAFTYVATAEVIALLGLTPRMVDVDPDDFNIDIASMAAAISERTRAIVPVHLFGQSAGMEAIMKIAREHGLAVVEDNAQAIGAEFTFSEGAKKKTGTIGDIGCISFFPSKNLGCYGDGGAITTNNDELAASMRMIANHGQNKKYYHAVIGVNSRLDSIQAAILKVKLKYLDEFIAARQAVADVYDKAFADIPGVKTPVIRPDSTHVFHQYTLKIDGGARGSLQAHLESRGIPSMIYYPVPLYEQEAFHHYTEPGFSLPVTEQLCREVISLPIHTEMDDETLSHITSAVRSYFELSAEAGRTN